MWQSYIVLTTHNAKATPNFTCHDAVTQHNSIKAGTCCPDPGCHSVGGREASNNSSTAFLSAGSLVQLDSDTTITHLLSRARIPQNRRPGAEKLAVWEAQRCAVVRHSHQTIVRLVICRIRQQILSAFKASEMWSSLQSSRKLQKAFVCCNACV